MPVTGHRDRSAERAREVLFLLQGADAMAVTGVPEPDGPAFGGRHQERAVRSERERVDPPGMAFEAVQHEPGPDVPDEHGAVRTTGGR